MDSVYGHLPMKVLYAGSLEESARRYARHSSPEWGGEMRWERVGVREMCVGLRKDCYGRAALRAFRRRTALTKKMRRRS